MPSGGRPGRSQRAARRPHVAEGKRAGLGADGDVERLRRVGRAGGGLCADRRGRRFAPRHRIAPAPADLRMLVGCGAGGAIAAAFGAPLTGAFYAFELIIGAYSLANVGTGLRRRARRDADHEGDQRLALRDQRARRRRAHLRPLWRADRARPRRGGARRRRDAGGGAHRTRVPRRRPLAPRSSRRRRADGRSDGALHAAGARSAGTARSGSISIGR